MKNLSGDLYLRQTRESRVRMVDFRIKYASHYPINLRNDETVKKKSTGSS